MTGKPEKKKKGEQRRRAEMGSIEWLAGWLRAVVPERLRVRARRIGLPPSHCVRSGGDNRSNAATPKHAGRHCVGAVRSGLCAEDVAGLIRGRKTRTRGYCLVSCIITTYSSPTSLFCYHALRPCSACVRLISPPPVLFQRGRRDAVVWVRYRCEKY